MLVVAGVVEPGQMLAEGLLREVSAKRIFRGVCEIRWGTRIGTCTNGEGVDCVRNWEEHMAKSGRLTENEDDDDKDESKEHGLQIDLVEDGADVGEGRVAGIEGYGEAAKDHGEGKEWTVTLARGL